MSARPRKFERLSEQLRQELRDNAWKAGERFYSENQLCVKYDVSRQTVRQALAALIDEGLLESRKGSGTFVTEAGVSSRSSNSRTIGILVTYLSDYIFPIIIKELEKVFTAENYYVYLASTGNSVSQERRLLQAMRERQVDGIILEPTKSALPNPNLDIYREMQQRGFPIICINACYPGISLPTIALNDEKAGYITTRYLIDHGHRKIGAVLKSDDIQGHLRYRGFQKAILEGGAEFHDERIYWYTTEDLPELTDEPAHILNRLSGCTAVLCYNDQIALSLHSMLTTSGLRVPEDISLISIDDSRYARMGPFPLTSARNPAAELGRMAARNLIRLIAGQNFPAGHIFEPVITERQSVARL